MTDSAGPPPRPEDAASGKKVPVDDAQPPPALSKDDYSRTTTSSPASTAIIPAVKDAPSGPATERIAPATPEPPTAAHASTTPNGVPEHAATVRLVRIDPWSVTRHAFVISVALMIVAVVAAGALWILLAMAGVWSSINDSMTSVLADDSGSFDVKDYLGFGRMVGGALVVSAINVVFLTALATIGAHLYNLVAAMLGGVEVTFAED